MDDNKPKRVKKRPMRRRVARRHKEFEAKSGGVSYEETIKRYTGTIKRRDDRIKVLMGRINDLKGANDKVIHELNIVHRRELKKLNTKIKNWEKRYKDFQKRKGIRHRTVIYKNKYKYYEHPTTVRNFEKTCLELKDNFSESHLESFEKIVKVMSFIETYNTDNNTALTLEHYLLLLVMLYSKPIIGGITAPKIVLPQMSQHKIRKGLNYLADVGLLTKQTRIRFKINLLGEEFLKDIKNFDSYGKSEVVETVKKISGYFKYEDGNDIDFENL